MTINNDILNRSEFVERLIDIIKTVSYKKESVIFAVDGNWGVGKTFVIDALISEIDSMYTEDSGDKSFWVFKYNAWDNDYYEEPLIGIVSSMIENLSTLLDEVGEKSYEVFKKALTDIAGQILENKIGINLIDSFEKGASTKNDIERFDSLYCFNKAMKELRRKIEEISKEKAIVFVVDEIDRCSPEYAIKVLERLHHLFKDISSTNIIIAVDTEQLEHSVKQIYGNAVDANRFLKKMIDFKVSLGTGQITSEFVDKYNDYFSQFELGDDRDDVIDIVKNLYDKAGIDIRNQEKIIGKAEVINNLIIDRKGSALLLFETMLLIGNYFNEKARAMDVDDAQFSNRKWIIRFIKTDYVNMVKVVPKKYSDYIRNNTSLHTDGEVLVENKKRIKIHDDYFGWAVFYLDKALTLADRRTYTNTDCIKEYYLEEQSCLNFAKLDSIIL